MTLKEAQRYFLEKSPNYPKDIIYYTEFFFLRIRKYEKELIERAIIYNKVLLINNRDIYNIESYDTIEDLKKVVDYIRYNNNISDHFKRIQKKIKPKDVYYEDGDIVAYLAKSKKDAIRYGKGYNWPISWESHNLFHTARRWQYSNFFVYNKQKKNRFADIDHYFVLSVLPKSTLNGEQRYEVYGSQQEMPTLKEWKEDDEHFQVLKRKLNVFQSLAITKKELRLYKSYKKMEEISLEEFKELSNVDKERYLEVHVNHFEDLGDEKFFLLSDKLKKKFIYSECGLSDEMRNYINTVPELKKAKQKVAKRIMKYCSDTYTSLTRDFLTYMDDYYDMTKQSDIILSSFLAHSNHQEEYWKQYKDKFLKFNNNSKAYCLMYSKIANEMYETKSIDFSQLTINQISYILANPVVGLNVWQNEIIDLDSLQYFSYQPLLNPSIAEKMIEAKEIKQFHLSPSEIVKIFNSSKSANNIFDSEKIKITDLHISEVNNITNEYVKNKILELLKEAF